MTSDPPPILPDDEAALVALSAAVAAGAPARVAARLDHAARVAEAAAVEEAILQSYLFVGFPAALNALALWRERVPGIAAPAEGLDPEAWASRGDAVCRTVYGGAYGALRSGVAALHPDVEAWMVQEGYGKVLGRPGLALGVRELCIVGLLAAQDAPRQLHSHLRGALNAGVPEERVEAALEVALAEAATATPDPAARDAEHRRVWAVVRDRHRNKRRYSSDPGEE